MKVFGLTGGIGMGKSTAAELLRARRVPVVDTDDLARAIVEPGQPALAEIREGFGARMIGADGKLHRGELARLVFGDSEALKKLEGILHPRIHSLWQAKVAEWRAGGETLVVVVIPLLFETGAEREFDTTVCVACSAATQHERLRHRDWDADQIAKRIQSQWPVAKKMELADRVIWTEGGMAVHAEQLGRIVRRP